MSRLLIAAVTSAVLLAAGCSQPASNVKKETGPAPPAERVAVSEEVAQEQARVFVEHLSEQRYADASAMMTEQMKEAMPTEGLEELWIGLQAKVGFFEALSKPRFTIKETSHVVRSMAIFEAIPLDLIVSIDHQQRVEGFFVRQVELPRPQTPQPPLPYSARMVVYENTEDGTTLGGTLTIPAEGERHPAVLLITGSGAQDRDSTLFGHKPFFVIADHLTRNGFVVLRVDDRGVGESAGDPSGATAAVQAADVAAGVAFLKEQAEVDPKKVGLLGHSMGGVVAPLVAADRKKGIAFVISLAGPGVSGADLSSMQLEDFLLRQGQMAAPDIEKLVALQAEAQRVFLDSGDKARVAELLEQVYQLSMKTMSDKHQKLMTDEMRGAQSAIQLATMEAPVFAAFMGLDPATHWKKVKCPVLVLIGDQDFQVRADANIAPVKKALAKARNKDVTATKLPGLNHLFQNAETGLIVEYAQLDETFDVATLDLITAWLAERFIE